MGNFDGTQIRPKTIGGGRIMGDLIIGIIGIVMLYGLGQLLYREPPHRPIQQEVIKMEIHGEMRPWRKHMAECREEDKELAQEQ